MISEKRASEQDSVKRFLASLDTSGKRVEDGFAALGYAGTDRTVTKAPPPAAPSRDWLAWIDVRGTDFSAPRPSAAISRVRRSTPSPGSAQVHA